jgi:hypothetical protein
VPNPLQPLPPSAVTSSRSHFATKMPAYLVRLAQIHESFRKAELHALAEVAGVEIEIVEYDDDVGTRPVIFQAV